MNKNILIIFAILVFTSIPTTLAFGEHIKGMLTAEEFSEVINKFARDADYVQQYVNFTITDHGWYRVYGMANGDREKAIEIFNHPDYPHNAFNSSDTVPENIPTFSNLFIKEIVSYKVDEEKGIFVIVNEKYANQENYDRYEGIFKDTIAHHLPVTFQIYPPTPFSGENSSDFIVPMMSFVIVTGMMIVFLVKKNKI